MKKNSVAYIILSAGILTSCFGGYGVGKNAEVARDIGVENVNHIFYGDAAPRVDEKNERDFGINMSLVGAGLAMVATGAIIGSVRSPTYMVRTEKKYESFYQGKRKRYRL